MNRLCAAVLLTCNAGCNDVRPSAVESAMSGLVVASSVAPTASSAPPKMVTAVAAEPRAMVAIRGATYTVGVVGAEGQPLTGLPQKSHVVPAFELDVTEVTVEAFRRCVAAGACDAASVGVGAQCNGARSDRDDHPMNCVPFAQAEAYCRWEGKRLPNEVEWEVAASLDLPGMMPLDLGGEADTEICLTEEYSSGATGGPVGTCAVGTRLLDKSKLKIADMMGNVSEWTNSHFCERDTPMCRGRVIRGSAWRGDYYESYRQRFREPGGTLDQGSREPAQVGFRCAR